MTVSELTAGTKVTCRLRCANRPWCRATKKPAESTAGTTATFRSCCSTTVEAASPPLVNLGKNKMAKMATATTAPRASAARMAWVNLRGIADSPFLGVDRTGRHHRVQQVPRWGRCELVQPALATQRCSRAGPGQAEAPDAGCEKNGAASCSERHR